jgi:hypothetical protein
MTIVALVPALVALASALVYALASNAKLVELARIAFFCGLLVFMFTLSASHVRLG